jgi:C1A family cysteine protease
MSSQCVNCNIQNSSSQYALNGSDNSGNTILPPRRRYNPIATFTSGSNAGTSNVVNKIVNVSQQNASSDSSSSRGMSSKSNLATLQSIQKVIDVASDVIVVTDTAKRSNIKLATDYQQQQLQNKQIANLNSLKKASRATEKASAATSTSGQSEKKKKSNYRNRNKTMGTSLASSPLFQAQFSLLAPIKIKPLEMTRSMKLPTSFDGRKVWKDYLQPVRTQGLCGSCYSFAAVFVLASRLSIYSKGKYNYDLSPSKLIFCSNPIEIKDNDTRPEEELIKETMAKKAPFDYTTPQSIIRKNIMSCSGETLISAWQFLYRFGVPEDSCLGYGDNDNSAVVNLTLTDEVTKSCTEVTGASYDICNGGDSDIRMVSHRAGGYYSIGKNEYDIQRDIYHWGPCSTGLVIHEDFLEWNGKGVYEWDKTSGVIGGHAVVLMGWGEEGGKKYWIVRNSWGEEWGDGGNFKVLRGENHCEIEENVFTGIPNIPAIRLYLEHPLYFQQEDFIYKYLWGLRDNGYKETTLELISTGYNLPKDFNEVLYDMSLFPNFSKYIAGESTEGFVEGFLEGYQSMCKKSNWKLVVIILILLYLIFLY